VSKRRDNHDIGIVGAGTAGLHLALLLQQRGVEATLYAERAGDEVRTGRLPNTVAHHHHTRARERELGVNHWDETGPSYARHWHYFGGEQPLAFPGDFTAPSLAVDYRLYQAQLLEDFEERGGRVRLGVVEVAELGKLAAAHDLIVVSTGRGGWSELFPRLPEISLDTPRRLLSAGLYAGIAYTEPLGVTFAVSPGHGEVIEIPLQTFEGNVTTLLFEAVPGGDLEVLSSTPYDADPVGYERLALQKLHDHFPPIFERADPAGFGLTRPSSILQGAVTPTVRQSYSRLDNSTCVIAVGDAHVTVDPLVGQGANSASYSAWTLGEAILEGGPLDEAFCRRVDELRLPFVLGVYEWTNFMTAPEPHLFALVGAMSQNPALADDFTENFNHPDRQWERLSSPHATAAYIAEFATIAGREGSAR
jgi:2-polyprenyl-6-methoxyphenol hydroxylase-like FAD-dependent oxidoreductase